MKITFDNQIQSKIERSPENIGSFKSAENAYASAAAIISPSLDTNTQYETGLKAVGDVMNEAFAKSISNEKDEMIVLAHTVSKEEFKDYLKNGNLKDVDLSDAVNIVDHIKMELIKGGTEIKGFTDTLDEDIKDEVTKAAEKASTLTEMTDPMKRYFVATGKEPTIDNLYLAKYTSGNETNPGNSQYFVTDSTGYLAKKADFTDDKELSVQVEDILSKEGYPVNDQTVSEGVWLVKNSLTIDKTHLDRLENINSVTLPISEEKVKEFIDIAVFEGKEPGEADLSAKETVYEEAIRITDEILKMSDSEVHATRVLEEARLKMTTEANLELIKSGFSIDTKDLEAYVEALRNVEQTPKFQESRAVLEVEETIKDIKEMPAAIIGKMLPVIPDADLLQIRQEGNKLKTSYESANIEYEKMFTEVRKDLGDSIKKAFRNVDDILSSIDVEATEENRRAVRILGYNSMEITKENIKDVRTYDDKLTNVLKSLTPADTLNLIRKGSSPVNLSINELSDYLEQKENAPEEKMEKYSKFLYKLELNDSINAEERQQYIDVYRLLHQLEKTGYAAIGGLLKTGKELSFGNLKEEIKTLKHTGMDVTIDESFGFVVKELESEFEPSKMKVMSLNDSTTLFEAYDAMSENAPDKEAEEAYANEQYREFKAGLLVRESSLYELLNNSEHVTATNLLATESMIYNRSGMFKRVDDIRKKDFRDEAKAVKDNFDDKDIADEKYEEMIDNSKEAVYEKAMESTRYVDVKTLMLTHKQLSLAASFVRNETYNLPMEIDGEMTDVVLKVIHNENEEPSVAVSLETPYLGRVNARFYVSGEKVEGFISCNYEETVDEMTKVADIFGEGVKAVYSKDAGTPGFYKHPMKDNSEKVSSVELYKTAKKFLDNLK